MRGLYYRMVVQEWDGGCWIEWNLCGVSVDRCASAVL